MTALPEACVPALWGAFFAIWWIWSWRSKATARAETRASRGTHLALLYASFFLLFGKHLGVGTLAARAFEGGSMAAWLGTVVEAAGLAFAIWARAALGANWSLTVTLKHGHELVRTGPYGIVRHPIYTGLLVMFLGTAIAYGSYSAFAGTALMAAAYLRKIRLEERWMREEFGEAYDRYAAEVRALVPFLY